MSDLTHSLLTGGLFILSFLLVLLIYRMLLKRLRKRALKTEGKMDDFLIELLRIPVLWLCFWILFKVFSSYSRLNELDFFDTLTHINNILLILTFGWIAIKVVQGAVLYLTNKQDVASADNLDARKNLTKMKIFEKILIGLIILITVSACLMTIESVRTFGVSLLTSAGIAGIIIGFAAQKSIATILAGIQIALTQPIRLDDVVIVEGEWGRIEEITLTYVVVKIWDERRLVLPVTYFIDQSFQNWTRNTSEILGTIFLYVDYSLPVDALREQLQHLLDGHSQWDGRVANIQVTDTKERYKELRVLLSSQDASLNWSLRVDIREKLIDFINKEYPGCFVKMRITSENTSA